MGPTGSPNHRGISKHALAESQNTLRPFGISIDPLLACGAGFGAADKFLLGSHLDEEFDDDEEESQVEYLIPLQHSGKFHPSQSREPEEEDSIADDGSCHPVLKTAVFAEGQEAMWIEDEVSTVASVLVRPQPKQEEPPKPSNNRFRFRPRPLQISTAASMSMDEEEREPERVQVKTKKVKKTVVLLPQQGDEGTNMLVEENTKQEAAVNMVRARQLLAKALVGDAATGLHVSENMAKVAFAHAAAARRIMKSNTEEPDLEDVLSVLAEKGEQAANRHQRIVNSESDGSNSVSLQSVDDPKEIITSTSYASKAFEYLESMFPKNVEQEYQESVAQEIRHVDTISTLGFKTDTFEYNLQPIPSQATKSFTNMELMSITSLNEILDGPDDYEEKGPSPRQVLPVIEFATRSPTEPVLFPTMQAEVAALAASTKVPVETVSVASDPRKQTKQSTTKMVDETNHVIAIPETETTSKTMAPTQKKKWGFFGKLRRRGGKVQAEVPQPLETLIEQSESCSVAGSASSDAKSDAKSSVASRFVTALPTRPSNSFGTDTEEGSKMSRYHVDGEESTVDCSQTREVDNQEEEKNKSDWDEGLDWEKPGFSKENQKKVAVIKANKNWGKSYQPVPTKKDSKPETIVEAVEVPTHSQKASDSIVSKDSCSTQPSEAQETAPKTSTTSPTQGPATENACGTTTQHEPGIKPQKSNPTPVRVLNTKPSINPTISSGQVSEKTSIPDKANIKVNAKMVPKDSTNEATSQTGQSVVSKNSSAKSTGSRSCSGRKTIGQKSETKDEGTFYTTQNDTVQDSLLDFVISPRRADIVTLGGTRPFAKISRDEPSTILVPVHHTPSQMPTLTGNDTSGATRTMGFRSRLAGIFGSRGKETNEPIRPPKEFQKALCDGNVKATLANRKAEVAPIAPPTVPPVAEYDVPQDDALEQAISKAAMKAAEANNASKYIPRGDRKPRHSRSKPTSESASDNHLVDAIRRQAGLERRGSRDVGSHKGNGDAPGESNSLRKRDFSPPRCDPPKMEHGDLRVLAPTPRNRSKEESKEVDSEVTSKHDETVQSSRSDQQRRIYELLYGPSSMPPSVTKDVSSRKVYIGDLIDPPVPSRVGTDQSEEDEEHDEEYKTQPVSSTPKSVLSGLQNWISN
eukprot:Nitzschia sp. Nitz4//scaffold18_size181773//113865//117302//NITZ4_001928-RA/size181773-processed-gene-0.57-mRNA-1//-1//CDS//3329540050//691//frame0